MPEYFCECCNFKTTDKTKYKRHTETSKHLELANQNVTTAVRVDTPPPKNDEIAELRAMVLDMSKTIMILNQKIDTLTIKLESQTQSIPTLTASSLVQPIYAPSPVYAEPEKKKRMTVEEEKKYIDSICEKLGSDAMEWLNDYVPQQKKPASEDPKSPYYMVDYYKYNLIAKLMINE
jgi:hypothetical protein